MFWTKQSLHLLSVALVVIGICSIWFSDPGRLVTAFGLMTAAALGFIRTTVTEMGQPSTEMLIPISYQADVQRAEDILVSATRKLTAEFNEVGEEALAELEIRYFVQHSQFDPKVFVRLTDSWTDLSVRFLTSERGIRDLKDQMSREILAGFNEAGIASSTYDIVACQQFR